MLPFTLRKDYLSFTDKKWVWRYKLTQNGFPIIKNPSFNELLPTGEIKKHFCEAYDKYANL